MRTMELALIQKLQQGFDGKVPVESLPALDTNDLLTLFGSQAPAIYVTPAPLSVEHSKITVRWEILVVSSLAAGQEEARQGTVNCIGSYQMAWRMVALGAAGIDVGDAVLYMKSLSWLDGTEGKKLAEMGVILCSALFEGDTAAPSIFDEDMVNAIENLSMAHVNYDVPPFTGQPDAQDAIPLGGEL